MTEMLSVEPEEGLVDEFVEPALDILYEDEYFIAINKPSGLLVHPSWIAPKRTPNATGMIKRYLDGATVHTIHRLDRATSGVILFGKEKETAKAMNQAFADRKVKKTYLCVTRGYTDEGGVIDYPLKEKLDKLADKYSNPDVKPKDAVSEYRRLSTVEVPHPIGKFPQARYSLVEVKPKTGRKHQIRRHMKHLSHPLVGDTKHGDGRHNALFREHYQLARMLLMATTLEFRHPVTEKMVTINAAVDQYTDQLFNRFGWQGLYPTESGWSME